MESVFLITDESGGKGFADKPESYPNEIGLVAGYVLRDETQLEEIEKNLTGIFKKYSLKTKHLKDIVSIYPENEELIRNQVFEVLKKDKIPILYHAIFVQGFHTEFLKRSSMNKESYELGALNGVRPPKDIRPKTLLSELYKFLIGRIINYNYELYETTELKINIISDHLDKGVSIQILNNVESFLKRNRNSSKEYSTKWYNLKTKQVEESFRLKISTFDGLPKSFDLTKAIINFKTEINSLTVGADIISGSIRKFLEKKVKLNPLKNLHSDETLSEYEYSNQIFGKSQNQHGFFSDIIYKHPKQ
ncbi:hypothetical protein AB3N62_10935 [Leptospira sp. WS4.C2]